MKLIELIKAKEPLTKLCNYGYFPNAVIGYYLTEPLKRCQTEYDKYNNINNKLFLKYATKDENGNITIKPNTPARLGYDKELQDVLNIEVDADFSKIKLNPIEILAIDDKLSIDKKLGFSAMDWLAIGQIITLEQLCENKSNEGV